MHADGELTEGIGGRSISNRVTTEARKEAPDASPSSLAVPHCACPDVPAGATPLPSEGTTPQACISPLSGRAVATTPVTAPTMAFDHGRSAAEGRARGRTARAPHA